MYNQTFSSSGLGKPPDDEATDKNHSIFSSATFNVAWLAGQLQRTHIFKEAEETRWILEILSLGGVLTILFTFPYSPLEIKREVSKAVSRRSDHKASVTARRWQWVKRCCDEIRGQGSVTEPWWELRVAGAEPSTPSLSWFQSQSWSKYVPQLLFLLLKSMTDWLFPTGICIPVTESILTPHIPALDGPRNKKNGHYASKDLGWQNLGRPQSKLSHIKGKSTFALHCRVRNPVIAV